MQVSLNKRTQSILIITGVFILLYFLMRFLPDSECGFLHYEEVINENGEVEYCATNSAGFIDLIQLIIQLNCQWNGIQKQRKDHFQLS